MVSSFEIDAKKSYDIFTRKEDKENIWKELTEIKDKTQADPTT